MEEGDKGLEIAWIDNSPEALRRQDAIRKKERQDKGDEEREQKLIREQIEKARRIAEEKEIGERYEESLLVREEGEKIKLDLNLGGKKQTEHDTPNQDSKNESGGVSETSGKEQNPPESTSKATLTGPKAESISLKTSINSKPKNVFAAASKKNAFGGSKSGLKEQPKKPISEAERIMRKEIERKRSRESNSFNPKRQKVS